MKVWFYLPLVHSSLLDNPRCYEFATKVRNVLKDKRGWSNHGYAFVELRSKDDARLVSNNDIMLLKLVPPFIMYDAYPQFKDEQLSVANVAAHTVDFNSDRWFGNIRNKSGLPLFDYQTYLVNHEVGHILGKGHLNPSNSLPSVPTPVMIQQTKGIGDFMPNPWPTDLDSK